MQAFSYVAPRTLSEAAAILAQEGDQAKCLSGGTDLIVFLREGRRRARVVVDVKGIPELNQLSYDPREGLTIGAAVPCYRICSDPQVVANYPGLIDAVALIGGAAIQGRATLGGNVCTASPAGDSIPALIAHEATCVVASPDGVRYVPIEQFFRGPGQTVLGIGELLVALKLPAPKPRMGAAYLRFTQRNEMDIAVTSAGVAVVLSEDKSRFAHARVALGAVAPTPLFVPQAGAALVDQPVSEEAVVAAARAAQAAARPITDMRGTAEQRRHLAYVLTRRALWQAIERARSRA
jgi:CO/xanthine dehydrogenase FAD-binding subunit